MIFYARLDSDRRIELLASEEDRECEKEYYDTQELTEVDVPDGFDFDTVRDYVVDSGRLVYSPPPMTEEEKELEREAKKQQQFYKAVQKLTAKVGFTADEALEFGYLYPDWGDDDAKYKKGELYVYEDSVYCCLKNHQQKHGVAITDPEYWELVGPIE